MHVGMHYMFLFFKTTLIPSFGDRTTPSTIDNEVLSVESILKFFNIFTSATLASNNANFIP